MNPLQTIESHLPPVPKGWAMVGAALAAWLLLFVAYWVLAGIEVAARGAASAIGGGF